MMYMLGILVAILLHAHMVLAVGECYTACKPRMLHGFVARRPANATYPSHLLEPVDASGTATDEFKFVGVNTPNLLRIETNSSDSRQTALPSASEIYDLLCGAQQVGARVVRTYVLSFCDDGTCHISNSSAAGSLAFNEDWFFAFDTAVAAANQLGLRLIVPFINVVDLEQWGGAASLARWAQVPAMNFFVDPLTRTMYKKVVWYVLSRRNRITGRLYKDEPAIFGWELGNELFSPMCNDLRPPHCGSTKSLSEMPPVPIDWTREMAAYIRSIDGGKHLIIDGGYVKNGQALQVADLDLVGGTYYSSDTTWLQQDVETVGGRLPFILKEFGLAGESNLSTVNETLGLLKSSKGIAGGLYWSFRGHAKEGGFYWHYEALYDKEAGQMIYPQALHWPGFDDSYPTYERTIIDLLTTANSDWDRSRVTIFNESSLGFIPCQPTVTVLDAGAFPPCFAFVGATGAARYEIWARAVGKLEENPEWFRLTGDAHDAVKERTSVMTFVDDDSVRQLMGFAGTSEGWQFCFQSCSLEGLCSDCSSPVLLTLNATGEPSSMCGNGSAILVGPRTEDVNQLGLLLLSFSPPLAIHIVEIIAQCLAALGAVVMLWLIHMHLFKQLKSVRKYASTEAMDLSDGSVHNAMPDLGVVAVPNLDPNDPTRGTWRQDIPIRLGVIYCISTLLILMDARRAQLLSLGFDSAGVHSALPLLFVAFGFDSWVRNMDTTTSQAKALSALGYASKHLARHAPAVIVSSCIGFAQTGSESLAGEYILLPLGLSVWIPSLRNNESNSLVWIAGALVFNSLLFLPLRDAMVKLSPSVKTRLQLLLCCWLVTAWQALDLIGLRLFLLDRFTAAIYLRTYAPSFIAGVLLASLHSDLANNTQISHWQSLSSLLSLLVLSAAMYVHIYLPGGWQGEFLDAWVHTGLYLPLVCMLVFGAARARRADPIAAMCGAMSLFAKAAPVCFTVLFFEQPIYGISAHILDKVVTSEWQILLVYLLIGLMFSPVFDYATRPLQHFIRSLLPADEYVVNTTYAESGRAGEEYAGVRLFIYYFGFVGIVVTFCMAQLFDPWVSIVDVSDLSAFSDFLSYFSWVLLLPAPCLLQCLLGFMIYPAVKEVGRKQKSITQQLEDEAKTKPVSIASRPPFKIHFRIVTRGKNPNLVLSNCQDALQVLRKSGLPESRFKVDVATDEHMDTMTEVPDVDEIVVPRDYSPPGGCKYKARALHYAAATSSSLHHDWIVHLDEETRFDVDTVEHIFAHCVKQEQDVARGVTQYPSIGQGVIYYNTATIDNYLTTLADYIRVADDYAKFQLQYKMFRLPLVGMHGSFVVCQTSLERDVGWDWGMVGSITEDTYFAMYLAAMGVRIDWCGGKMYEQSPFSCSDFAKQRARWFSGLWLCVLTNTLPLWQRAFLGSHLVSWSLCPLFTLVTWVNLLVLFPRSDTFVYLMSFVFAIPFFGYVLGYVLGSSPSQFRHGIVEWALLLIVHVSLIPVYTIMETWGVARGILDRSTYSGFHVVQKERAPENDSGALPADSEITRSSSTNQLHEPRRSISSSSCELAIVTEHEQFWRQRMNIEYEDLDLVGGSLSNSESVAQIPPVRAVDSHQLEMLTLASDTDTLAVVVAIVGNVLQKYVRGGDVMLGVKVADDNEAALDIIPVHICPSDGTTFHSLVLQVSTSLRDGIARRSALTLDALRAMTNRPTLFHAIVQVQESRHARAVEGVSWLDDLLGVAKVGFLWYWREGALSVSSFYDGGRFTASSMERLQGHVAVMSAKACQASAEQPAAHLMMMSPEELRLVTHTWARGSEEGGVVPSHARMGGIQQPHTLQELVEAALSTAKHSQLAVENPKQAAKLSYKELDMATKTLAKQLQESHGVGPMSVVAVAAERSIETIISILSIVRTGAAYMPVDVSYPAARLQHMLSESKASILLCTNEQASSWRNILASPEIACVVESIDYKTLVSSTSAVARWVEAAFDTAGPSDRAAILYTSGSTGLPKGVEISHGALARQQAVMVENRTLQDTDRVVHETILTFDVAGNEIWGCLHARGTLVIVDDDTRLLGFESFLLRQRISVLFITPSHLGLLSPASVGPSLRMLVMAGEALPSVLVDKWATSQRSVYNEYGPTETNVVTTRCCSKHMSNPNSIGRPLPGVTLAILDKHCQPVAIGVAGELCVAGEQLAIGYLNSPELTAAKFVEVQGMRMYKTGDSARWLPDGSIDFCGRIDHQVKIRGMRVETSEIESAILSLAGQPVNQCAVLLQGAGDVACLVAFVCLQGALEDWNEDHVRAHLGGILPQHMVPAVFEVLDKMPTTSSGKINRKELMQTPVRGTAGDITCALDSKEDTGLNSLHLMAPGVSNTSPDINSYLASEDVKALKRLGVDSLGIARRYFLLVQDMQIAAWELQVADGVRALCMLGVIIDHFASCMPGNLCQGFLRAIIVPGSRLGRAQDTFAIAAEVLIRSIGNYKTIAGFVMTSAYMDAGTGPAALSFSRSDLVIYLIYLEMAWILDPIATAAVGASGYDVYDPWWLSNHRWYLLAMLICRFSVVVMHACRVSPAGQIILSLSALFLLPPNMVCVSSVCEDGFVDVGSGGQLWQGLFTFFYIGTEPQRADFPYAGFRYLITRKYLLCVFLYVVTFHYGRPSVRKALEFAAEVRSSIDRVPGKWIPKTAKVYLPRFIYGLAACWILLASCIHQSLHFEALEDNWVQEAGMVRQQATLPHLGVLIVLLILQICMLAAMVSALPNMLSWTGSSTLGSYVAHSYINLLVTITILNNSSIVLTTPSYLAIVLGVAALTQLVIGPLVQWAFFFHLHKLVGLAAKVSSCLGSQDKKQEAQEGSSNDTHSTSTRQDNLDVDRGVQLERRAPSTLASAMVGSLVLVA